MVQHSILRRHLGDLCNFPIKLSMASKQTRIRRHDLPRVFSISQMTSSTLWKVNKMKFYLVLCEKTVKIVIKLNEV